jgi:hypothetical protein
MAHLVGDSLPGLSISSLKGFKRVNDAVVVWSTRSSSFYLLYGEPESCYPIVITVTTESMMLLLIAILLCVVIFSVSLVLVAGVAAQGIDYH